MRGRHVETLEHWSASRPRRLSIATTENSESWASGSERESGRWLQVRVQHSTSPGRTPKRWNSDHASGCPVTLLDSRTWSVIIGQRLWPTCDGYTRFPISLPSIGPLLSSPRPRLLTWLPHNSRWRNVLRYLFRLVANTGVHCQRRMIRCHHVDGTDVIACCASPNKFYEEKEQLWYCLHFTAIGGWLSNSHAKTKSLGAGGTTMNTRVAHELFCFFWILGKIKRV